MRRCKKAQRRVKAETSKSFRYQGSNCKDERMSRIFILGSATVAGGIPEDVSRAGIQFLTAVLAWLSVEVLAYVKKKLKK